MLEECEGGREGADRSNVGIGRDQIHSGALDIRPSTPKLSRLAPVRLARSRSATCDRPTAADVMLNLARKLPPRGAGNGRAAPCPSRVGHGRARVCHLPGGYQNK